MHDHCKDKQPSVQKQGVKKHNLILEDGHQVYMKNSNNIHGHLSNVRIAKLTKRGFIERKVWSVSQLVSQSVSIYQSINWNDDLKRDTSPLLTEAPLEAGT